MGEIMAESPQARLRRIADLLGPDLWLEIGRERVSTYFGYDLDGPDRARAIKAAKEFAEDTDCVWGTTPDGYGLRFGRTTASGKT